MNKLLIFFMIPVLMLGQLNIKTAPWKAMGNGLVDDTAAINMTIDAVALSGGGTVYCPSGTYSVSSPIKWTASDVYFEGDGGCNIVPTNTFKGDSVIKIGQASEKLSPTYYGGINNIRVDLSKTTAPNLVGVELVQTWFTVVDRLKITSINGLAIPRQTAFQMNAGELPNGKPLVNWSSNNAVSNLQITGSFAAAVRHVTGCSPVNLSCFGQVNGTVYTGGFGFNNSADKTGTYGFKIDSGDSTKVYGFALEDYDTCAYVGTQNNGPFDFRFEDCSKNFKFGKNITASVNSITTIGQ